MKYMHYNDITIIKLPVHPFFRHLKIHLYYMDGFLIDAGPSAQKRQLKPVIRSLDVNQTAITHHHEDHAGLASWMGKQDRVKVFCDQRMPGIIKEKENMSWFSKLFVGAGRPFHGEPFPRVIKTSAYEFHPISTPGHTSDHVCLLEPNKGWLFTGDLYVTPYPKVFLKDESISDYIESLEYLQSLDYDTVFCAHEGVIENGKEKMAKKLAYLKRIRSEVVQLHKLGYSDQGIRSKIFPKRVKLELISFGFFSRLHLIRSCYKN